MQKLVDAKAWNDAALALVDIELPHWSLVRLAFDDGEWTCTLSKYPQLAAWLDDSIDARHAVMSLAILAAVVEAREIDACEDSKATATVSDCRTWYEFGEPLSCDNFA
jgi:hypothetical protein